jgi:hypothetical protein
VAGIRLPPAEWRSATPAPDRGAARCGPGCPAIDPAHWPADQTAGQGFGAPGAAGAAATPRRAPKGWRRDDACLQDAVCGHLAHQPGLEVAAVTVTVVDGQVTLTGDVSDRTMKRAIEDGVDAVHGVRDIANRIRAGCPLPGASGRGG